MYARIATHTTPIVCKLLPTTYCSLPEPPLLSMLPVSLYFFGNLCIVTQLTFRPSSCKKAADCRCFVTNTVVKENLLLLVAAVHLAHLLWIRAKMVSAVCTNTVPKLFNRSFHNRSILYYNRSWFKNVKQNRESRIWNGRNIPSKQNGIKQNINVIISHIVPHWHWIYLQYSTAAQAIIAITYLHSHHLHQLGDSKGLGNGEWDDPEQPDETPSTVREKENKCTMTT